MDAINPATGDVIATYPPDDAVAVSRALNAAVEAQAGWHHVAIGDRAEALTAWASRFGRNAPRWPR